MTGGAVLAGYAADLALGDPARGHPVAGFGRVAAALERRTWRPRRRAGAGHVAVLTLGAAALAWAADRVAAHVRLPLRAGLLWTALGGRSLAREGRRIAALVRSGDVAAARARVPALVGRDPRALDGPDLCRAALESIAENTADAVVAPLLWGAVAGPGGAIGHRASNTLDAMIGHRSPRYERFGWAAARLDDVLGWPAARAGALLTVALAPAINSDARAAWRTLRRDGARHPSPNAGRMEAAFAGALGVRLGGSNVYGGRVEERPPLGDGRPPEPDDVDRAARLSLLVGAASALGAAGLAELRSRRWTR